MKKKLTFLGIETSCDETAAAIVQEKTDGTAKILSNVISSQIHKHNKYGGVVPEIAARTHLENIEFIINKAVKESKYKLDEIDGIAVTAGPGLIVCLTVGLNTAKTIAGFLKKPFVAVNHLEGHALSPGLETNLKYPFLLLLISGGHSQYLIVKGINNYVQLGTTIDDALGEAYDKVAKMLGLNYPGGPSIEKFALNGNKKKFKLPRPIINKAGCNLSFAGLKTAVLREVRGNKIDNSFKENMAASFQNTITEILKVKSQVAMDLFEKETKKSGGVFVVAGGVAANKEIRKNLEQVSKFRRFKTLFPDQKLCGDNAAMIAWAGIKRFKKKLIDNFDIAPKSRWQLDSTAPYMKGPGLKLK